MESDLMHSKASLKYSLLNTNQYLANLQNSFQSAFAIFIARWKYFLYIHYIYTYIYHISLKSLVD